jgi:hypothetical protein
MLTAGVSAVAAAATWFWWQSTRNGVLLPPTPDGEICITIPKAGGSVNLLLSGRQLSPRARDLSVVTLPARALAVCMCRYEMLVPRALGFSGTTQGSAEMTAKFEDKDMVTIRVKVSLGLSRRLHLHMHMHLRSDAH